MPRVASIPTTALIETAISCVQATIQRIKAAVESLPRDPDASAPAFARQQRLHIRGGSKILLQMDSNAEELTREEFRSKFQDSIQFEGEESLGNFSEWRGPRVCILADMLDGTDLAEMGIDLWCSAIVLFDQVARKILGAVVGLPNGDVYYSHEDHRTAAVRGPGMANFDVYGCSAIETLRTARVAFYGQKPKNILPLIQNAHFTETLLQLQKDAGASFRIYNFAGNPMMVKLVNRPKLKGGEVVAGNVDAVFDVCGQRLHDVVPGAYIAMKAGAFMCDLQGREITFEELGVLLYNPLDTLTYVLASTAELARELAASLSVKQTELANADPTPSP